jgi:hypothetical protein
MEGIMALIVGVVIGYAIKNIRGKVKVEGKECENCKRLWISCGGSGFGSCERWEKK